MKQITLSIIFAFIAFNSKSQVINTATLDTTGGVHIKNLSIGGYLDLFYGFDMNESAGNVLPYMTSMNRHNEFNVNLAYLDVRYQNEKIRARFVPGFGTYMNSNYASEPGTLKDLVEANAGIKLGRKKNIWLDFGILGSPYTNESAISKDHLMYTRSIGTEYVPYYLAGAKLSIPLSQKINFSLYVINGWQQIQDQNNGKSIATQIEIRPNTKHLFNWNTYLGDERSTTFSDYRMRYFSDVFWLFNSGKKISSTICASVGLQEKRNNLGQRSYYMWWASSFIASYHFTTKLSLSGRVEYYNDPNRIEIMSLTNPQGFVGGSAGLCFNYKVTDHALFRLEGRHFLASDDQYLNKDGNLSNNLTWIIGNVTVWF